MYFIDSILLLFFEYKYANNLYDSGWMKLELVIVSNDLRAKS